MTELVAMVLSLATLFLQQSSSTQTTDATSWPIPGVERPGDGVTAPILVHETKPNYTGEAMRTRIQGVVVHQEKAEDIRRAGIEFGRMLRRITIRPK